MTTKPRLVLDQLIAAFENHYEVASSDQVDEQALIDAEEALRDAFFTYDDVLFTQFEVELPFDLIVSDEEDEDEDLTTTKMMKKSMTMNSSILMRTKTKNSRSSCL